MKRSWIKAFTCGLGCILLATALASCKSTATPQLSKQEQSQFKGGPMPESARAEVQRRMQAAQQQQRGNAGATATPPAAGR